MEGTLWQKGRLSYEKRHFCVEEDENGELCLVGRIKTREGKVDNKLLLASLEQVDVVDEQTYEFFVEAGGMTLNLRVESRSEFAQWVNGLRAVLGMPDVEFTMIEAADGSTFAAGLSEAMPPAHPSSTLQQPLSHASPPASGGQVAPPAAAPNPPPPAYSGSTAAPPRPTAPPAYQAGSNLTARSPISPGARPPPSRYPVIGGGGAAGRAVAGYNSAQPPPPAYAAASLGYQDGAAMAPPTAPGYRQTAPPRGAAGWLPSAVAEAAPPAPVPPVPRSAGPASAARRRGEEGGRGGAAGGGADWAGGQAEEEEEGAQELEAELEEAEAEEAELEEVWLSEVEPAVLEAARELGIRLEVRSERRHLWVAVLYALEPLAEGWSKQTDGRGRAYFYQAESGESRWRAPAYDAHRALLEDQHAASRALDAQAGGAAAQRALRLQRARSLAATERDKEGVEEGEDEPEALDESMGLAFHQLLTAGFFRVDERTVMFSA